MNELEHFPPREVLAPTDLSEISKAALAYARLFHEHFGSRITVLHAESLEAPPYFTRDQAEELLARAKAMRKDALEHVEREAESVLAHRSGTRIVDGPPAPAILTAAKEIPADLIVMGSRGRGAVESFFMGSVTDRVVRQAAIPVLATPIPPPAVWFRRILCPLDYGAVSRRALDYASAVAEIFDSRLDVVEEEGSADAVERILRAAHEGDFDLVVLGVERKSSLWGELMSSTTERVMRVARKPLLLIPDVAKEERS
jgi:nucleotide-binding universal stress UspA family protein